MAEVEAVRELSPEQVEAEIAATSAHFPDELRALMVQSSRDRLARLPLDLEPSYLAAVRHVDAVFGPGWRPVDVDSDSTPKPRHWRRHVRYLRSAGWNDNDIAFAVHTLRDRSGSDRIELVYRSFDTCRDGLCALKTVPVGWFERTRLRLPEGDLGLCAVRHLARWDAIDVDVVLSAVDS